MAISEIAAAAYAASQRQKAGSLRAKAMSEAISALQEQIASSRQGVIRNDKGGMRRTDAFWKFARLRAGGGYSLPRFTIYASRFTNNIALHLHPNTLILEFY